MSTYTIKKGQHLTIKGTATDDDGGSVTVTSGYTFSVVVKRYHSTADASALVDIDSTNDASRFSTSTNTVTVTAITSAESDAATPGQYYFDAWAKETASGQETPIDTGIVIITDSATDTKG